MPETLGVRLKISLSESVVFEEIPTQMFQASRRRFPFGIIWVIAMKIRRIGLLSDRRVGSVVIAGAGGFGLEIYDYLEEQTQLGGPPVAGFIDDTPGALLAAGYLGTIEDFCAEPDQVVVVAIGSVAGRRAVLKRLWQRGVLTPPFVANHALVSSAATLGMGTVVCPFSLINREARVGQGIVINVYCSVGHGATVGDHSILSPYSALNGNAAIGSDCFLGTRATIYPKVRIGNNCIVDSHAGVRANTGDWQMISCRGNYVVSPIRTR